MHKFYMQAVLVLFMVLWGILVITPVVLVAPASGLLLFGASLPMLVAGICFTIVNDMG